MKKCILLLCGLGMLLGSCNKEDEIAPNSLLDGEFSGKILVEIYDWNGKETLKIKEDVYPMSLLIDGNTFKRADCGCDGNTAINEAESTVTFTTSQKECETNWIIRTFKYSLNDDKIQLLFQDNLNNKLKELTNSSTRGAFHQITISADRPKSL